MGGTPFSDILEFLREPRRFSGVSVCKPVQVLWLRPKAALGGRRDVPADRLYQCAARDTLDAANGRDGEMMRTPRITLATLLISAWAISVLLAGVIVMAALSIHAWWVEYPYMRR
jgi:hypothetical protein